MKNVLSKYRIQNVHCIIATKTRTKTPKRLHQFAHPLFYYHHTSTIIDHRWLQPQQYTIFPPLSSWIWPGNETKWEAWLILSLILYNAGELAGLHDVAFVSTEKFYKIYITLYNVQNIGQ